MAEPGFEDIAFEDIAFETAPPEPGQPNLSGDALVYLVRIEAPQFFEYFALYDQSGTQWFYHFTAGGGLAFGNAAPTHPILPAVPLSSPATGNPTYLTVQDENSNLRYLYPRDGFGELLGDTTPPGGTEWPAYAGLTLVSLGFDAPYTLAGSELHPWRVIAETVEPQRVYFAAGDRFPFYGSTLWRNRLRSVVSFTTEFPVTEGLVGGVVSPRFGSLQFDISDETFDLLASVPWDGRPVEIFRGEKGSTFPDDFVQLLQSTIEQATWTTEQFTITLADPAEKIRQNVQPMLYGGTGQLDGDASLKGRPKPLAYGYVRNIRPVFIDHTGLVFQCHSASIQSILDVFDQAVALTNAGDITTLSLADVYAWTPVPGQYVTDLAQGLFRLGASPVGQITADILGHNGGGYVSSSAQIINTILQQQGGLTPQDIDGAAFNAYQAALPGTVGIYIDIPRQISSVVTALAVGAVWGYTPLGLVTIQQLDRTQAPIGTITEEALVDPDRISRLPTPVPPWRLSLGYRRSWAVQSEEQVAAAATDARKEFVAVEQRLASVQDQDIRTIRLLSRDIAHDSLLDDEADAQAETERQHRFLKEGQSLWRTTARGTAIMLLKPKFGDVVTLQHSRFGLQNGRRMVIAGIEFSGQVSPTVITETYTLTLWG